MNWAGSGAARSRRGEWAKVQRVCAIADHLSLMPETDGLAAGLVEVLQPFREVKNDPDAPYLLVGVVDALDQLGAEAEAKRVFERYHVMLPNKRIKKLGKLLDHSDGFLPKLAKLEIDGKTIARFPAGRRRRGLRPWGHRGTRARGFATSVIRSRHGRL